jgi:hypothetical protein
MKRDKWTNDEVIGILEDFLFYKDGVIEDTGWNNSLLLAISQFGDFKRPIDDYAAMAYDTKTKDIVVIGQPLPR